MPNNLEDIKARKHKLIADATEFVTRTGLKTSEDKAQHQRMLADIDAVTEDISNLEMIERRLNGSKVQPSSPATSSAIIAAKTPEQRTNQVWRAWLKSGYSEQIPEHRDLLSSSDGAGGALIPQEIETSFVSQALAYYAPLAHYARMRVRDTSRPQKIIRVDDRANGLLLIQENGAPPEVDPTSFSSTVVSLDPLTTGEIKFSNQLYEDSDWSLVDFLGELASVRYGRGLERILTNGKDSAGTATPNNPGIRSIASTAATTATLAAGVGWADLINTFDALDAAYLPRAVWQMTSKTRNALAKLEDSTSRPYFVPAPNSDSFDMLLGQPIVLNQSLDQLGTANGIPVVFGSLYDGLEVVTRRLRVITLRERYADVNESALLTYTNVGSTGLAPGALQKLVLAAS